MHLTSPKRTILLFTILMLQMLCSTLTCFASTQDTDTPQGVVCEAVSSLGACDQQDLTQEDPLLGFCSTAITCVFAINAVPHSLPSKLPQPAYAIFVPPQ